VMAVRVPTDDQADDYHSKKRKWFASDTEPYVYQRHATA
jgi:hypothetical protein